ncbi:MAG TPA: hypothetical protein VFR19_25600, partial [Hyphomicrobiaceae bacterium]|nr:hypothetical protein [Hyphomicrobiaceae bacterium]
LVSDSSQAMAIDRRGISAMTTSLVEQIEEMRVRMNQLARREQDLVRALGQALNRADQKLLQDVRNVAIEHEVRREGILRELQNLAARMGALPMPRSPYASLENAPIDVPVYEPNQPAAPRTGDWRQAAANLREHLPN